MFFVPILSFLIFLPLIAIAVILTIRADKFLISENIKYIAILTSFIHLILCLYLWFNFDKVLVGSQFVEKFTFISSIDFSYYLGIDGISLVFIIISSFIIFFIFLFVEIPINHSKTYVVSLLCILSGAVGTFAALDIIMFYMFYEMSIIPVFFIIGIMGEGNKAYATLKFTLYTIAGSMFMLIAIVGIISLTQTSSIPDLTSFAFNKQSQIYLFIALFIAFAVKVALFPFHTWLPDTYKSSPLFMNIILSGILMKYGIYGIIRFIIPFFPLAVISYVNIVYALCFITIVYSSLIAFKQESIKGMFAYFSISHIGLIVAGIFATNTQGFEGAIFQSISHSILNIGLFIAIIFLHKRFLSDKVSDFQGITTVMPKFSIAFMVFFLAGIGFPLTNAFIGEFLLLFGIFQNNRIVSLLFAFSILLSAVIMVSFNRKILFGNTNYYTKNFKDTSTTESIALYSIAAIILLMGIYPDLFLDIIRVSVSNIYEQFKNGIIIRNDI